ncbi:MAG: HU family DNA-binding protein [Ardenticatenaceae bacterium]|nr:HU family DNA-binding protein [Ardenticatenaceae bacterium]MCB9446479.1 HU family DNA-binding protein [Ardenticatenaceae bacterium]
MSVKYNVVERGNPSDPNAPKKYYPSAIADGSVDLRYIANRAADISTVSMPDTVAVIEALLHIIPDELGNGRVVQLGDFGSFWIKFKTEASETAQSVTSRSVTGVVPRFIPGKEFKRNLRNLTFEKK